MATQSRPSAVIAVLSTTELLESIIVQLPMTEILSSATRVSREWKQLIDSSPRIQQKQFFLPRSARVATPQCYGIGSASGYAYEEELEVNPSLERETHDKSHLYMGPQQELWSYRIQEDQSPAFRPIPGHERKLSVVFTRDEEQTLNSHLRAWQREEASWRGMFLTDPPCSILRAYITSSCIGFFRDRARFTIQDQDGIRLSLLERLVTSAFQNMREYRCGDEHQRPVRSSAYLTLLMPVDEFGDRRSLVEDNKEVEDKEQALE